MDYPALRREQLRRVIVDEGLDALLVTSPVNITYLTGFTGEASILLLGRERTLLVSDSRFTQQIAEECPGLAVHIRPPSQQVHQAVAEILTKIGFRSVGLESAHVTIAEWESLREQAPAVTWKAGTNRVEKLRAVKDASELEEIREAVRLAERAFAAFRALIRPEDSEKELCDALDSYIRRFGGQGTSFPSIVAVDDRAALPHAPPTERTVANSRLLLVDWGASGRLYKSDLTRVLLTRKTSAFSRTSQQPAPDAKLEEVYTVVAKAQEQALRTLRPGIQAQQVDAEARAVIAEAGFGAFFGHGLGHGLGLQVHEAPALRPKSETLLEAGMVVTVEPGIYLPGWGGVRIEDDVLITPDGCEVLTSLPKAMQSMSCEL